MPLLPYSLVRPVLFGMDAERAHDISLNALSALQRQPLRALLHQPLVQDPLKLAGLHFPNRIGLAAGLDKNARCIDAWGAMGFGFVEVGTVTPLAQSGNPKPRMFRLAAARALINRLGFNNGGLNAFIANVQGTDFRRTGRILGLNIGKNAATPIESATLDYLTCLEGVYPHADYVSVNISSPNTQNLRSLQSDAALDALLHALADRREALSVLHHRRIPLFVKIAPDLHSEQVQAIAEALKKHGMDGVVATNTTLDRQAVAHLPNAQETGGLSGAPLLAPSNRVITQLRQSLGTSWPIIGVGGVMSAADALSKITAGADVVQIYSGLIYRGPTLVRECAQALLDQRTVPTESLEVGH